MYETKRIAVVIPCYNVADHVAEVVTAVPNEVDVIVAVDDASHDDTLAVLQRLTDPRLALVRHEYNGGMGAAMRSGYDAAVQAGADVLVKVDGDGQMELERIWTLLTPVIREDYSYAKGNRLFGRRAVSGMPVARLLGNLGLTILAKFATGYWHVADPVNGFTAMRAEAWAKLDHAALDPGYFFQIDVLVQLRRVEARVKDVQMPARYAGERSSLRVFRVLGPFALLLADRAARRAASACLDTVARGRHRARRKRF